MSKLFSPIKIKNITIKNRVIMSPMCQYSATDGLPNEWHFVHYSSRAIGGSGAIIVEATAVNPEGRISYADLGLWNDSQLEAFKKIISFITQYGSVPGIQLAHAGRKGSDSVEWLDNGVLEGSKSWQTVSCSPLPFDKEDKAPKELTVEEIKSIVLDFKKAAIRAKKAGFKILEIHAAHGYLIHQFLSPISNIRKDEYGGSFANRIRFLLEVVDAVNTEIDEDHSLWVRISATDWVEGGWNEKDSVELAKILKDRNVDIIDTSTGGNVPHAKIPVAPNYQIPFAEKIKQEAVIKTAGVGLITTGEQAESLLNDNKCDLIMIGREFLRDPYFALHAQKDLEKNIDVVPQYGRAF